MSEKEPLNDHPKLQPLLGPSSTLFQDDKSSEQVHRDFLRWTVYEPKLAYYIFFFSVVQLACSRSWFVKLDSDISVPLVFDFLLAWCSVIRILPLSRNNEHKKLMISSSIFFILYLASTLRSVGACVSSGKGVPHGLRRAECHDVTKGVWYTLLASQWCSIVAWGIYGVLAWKAHRAVLKDYPKDRDEI